MLVASCERVFELKGSGPHHLKVNELVPDWRAQSSSLPPCERMDTDAKQFCTFAGLLPPHSLSVNAWDLLFDPPLARVAWQVVICQSFHSAVPVAGHKYSVSIRPPRDPAPRIHQLTLGGLLYAIQSSSPPVADVALSAMAHVSFLKLSDPPHSAAVKVCELVASFLFDLGV